MALARVCVFCGSNPGGHPDYVEAARATGRALAARGVELVYGGGNVGLMGEVADAVLDVGGRVIGVIPRGLEAREVAHRGVTQLIVTGSMHERKARMADLSDAFLALPGGLGTCDETFEIATWAQLGLHAKPLGLVNVRGYFDHLIAFVDHAVRERFVHPQHRGLLRVGPTAEALLDAFANPGGPSPR
jgi:uncharacterized protein (TIGR00730 family)